MSARVRYLAALVVVAAAVGLPTPAVAADPPTLGGTLSPVPFYADQSDVVNVTNRATVPVTVTLEGTEGWALAEPTLHLEPGERVSVPVTAIGADGGLIRAVFVPVATGGMDTTQLVLQSRAAAVTPAEVPWSLLILAALVAAFALLVIGRKLWTARSRS